MIMMWPCSSRASAGSNTHFAACGSRLQWLSGTNDNCIIAFKWCVLFCICCWLLLMMIFKIIISLISYSASSWLLTLHYYSSFYFMKQLSDGTHTSILHIIADEDYLAYSRKRWVLLGFCNSVVCIKSRYCYIVALSCVLFCWVLCWW